MAAIIRLLQTTMTPFILAFSANSINAAVHQHAAYQIVLSQQRPFISNLQGQPHENIYGFIVKPQVAHACWENKNVLDIINVEPYSAAGHLLEDIFPQKKDYLIFPKLQAADALFKISGADDRTMAIIDKLTTPDNFRRRDERVDTIIGWIQKNYGEMTSPQQLAGKVFLSPSRLAALFKEQTGSSLSKYMLWTRLRQAVTLALTKKQLPLTDIAFDTGFYDLPQLNKYMYEMIGVTPSVFRQNSDIIQMKA